MIINEKEAVARLTSPGNLINRLKDLSSNGNKRKDAMALFGVGFASSKSQIEKPEPKSESKSEPKANFNPFDKDKNEIEPEKKEDEPLTIDKLMGTSEVQINLGLAHDNAIKLLNNSLSSLASKLDDISPARLPSVIVAASKTVQAIRHERLEREKNSKDRDVHFHFYTPEQKKVSDYEIIDVVAQ